MADTCHKLCIVAGIGVINRLNGFAETRQLCIAEFCNRALACKTFAGRRFSPVPQQPFIDSAFLRTATNNFLILLIQAVPGTLGAKLYFRNLIMGVQCDIRRNLPVTF